MVLHALEFSDCLLDSPHFRERLNAHEKELDNTSKVIKKIIQEGKDLINAAKTYAKAQRSFAQTLMDFKFETIGSQQTDEEIVISKSLRNFGDLITNIEEARDTMMERVKETFVDKLEEFRKNHIVSAKDERKRFEKTTKQYCTALEKHLALKPGKSAEGQIQESDSTIESERGQFHKEAMAYVMKLQEVQERKKFEFVEILLAFMYGWKTFYHQGYETGQEMEPYLRDLGVKLNKTRENFESTRDEASQLMNKMSLRYRDESQPNPLGQFMAFARYSVCPLVKKPSPESPVPANKMFTRQGYLFAMEKKALGTVSWNKYFCSYQKEAKIFTMIPFHQTTSNAGKLNLTPDTMVLASCVRRATESIERRFCFDITIADRPSGMTLQALSDKDRQEWLEAMDGKEPVYAQPVLSKDSQDYMLDNVGFTFAHKCIDGVESRGITDQGLYRVVGVSSKVTRLMQQGLDPKKIDKLNLSDPSCEFEVKTITSALKSYFRKLSEPLMTFKLHQKLISAAKLENRERRVDEISNIVRQLPSPNYKMLSMLIRHLHNVAAESDRNMMSISNLSVCFGPTLLRPEEETVAAIMDIKFCNLVVEIMLANCERIFSKETSTNELAPESSRPPAKSAVQKLYSEESTYGKHRPSYRASSVYANIPHNVSSTSPTRPESMPPTNSVSVSRPATTAPTRPDLPTRSNGANHNNNSISTATDSKRSTQEVNKLDMEGKVTYSNSHLRPDRPELYGVNKSPSPGRSGAGNVGKLVSQLNYPVKQHNYTNVTPSNLKPTNPVITPTEAYNVLRSPMSKSYAGAPTAVTTNYPPPNSLHMSHGPGALSKFIRGVTRSSRTKSRYLKTSVPGPGAALIHRRVRAIYACEAENESELSFEPNDIIYNVKESREPGWLEGTLSGKTGLLPANYVEYIN